MKKLLITSTVALLFIGMAVLPGCSKKPTGLDEALVQTMRPANGIWKGTTDQGKPVSFTVGGDGTSAYKFLIEIRVYEDWGWADLIGFLNRPMNVTNNKFLSGLSDFDIRGTFTSPYECEGTFHGEGVALDSANNPHNFSESVTWQASLVGAPSKSIFISGPTVQGFFTIKTISTIADR